MTLVQLEYVLSLASYRSFSMAAEKCFVTQPTLSMQIQKLEEEIGIILFDRHKKPVIPTEAGLLFINQARNVLQEAQILKDKIGEIKNAYAPELNLAIIPTIAPYLLPILVPKFSKQHPNIALKISELTTDEIINQLDNDLIDAAILSTPIERNNFHELELYREKLALFVSPLHPLYMLKTISLNEIKASDLWLLKKGHCFRDQAIQLCKIPKESTEKSSVQFESGSIDTIVKILENQSGITVLPELAWRCLPNDKAEGIKNIKDQIFERQVSILTRRSLVKSKTIKLLVDSIKNEIKPFISEGLGTVIPAFKKDMLD